MRKLKKCDARQVDTQRQRAADGRTDGRTDRRGRSYLLNLLVAGRHGRENATKFKRLEKKMFRASKIIEEDPET